MLVTLATYTTAGTRQQLTAYEGTAPTTDETREEEEQRNYDIDRPGGRQTKPAHGKQNTINIQQVQVNNASDAVTPIPRFLHFTLNELHLRAFDGHDRVHVIDFDFKQGLQWPGLLQSLAARASPPAHVRITGVGESRQDLQETGARLGHVAASRGLAFEFHFHAVVDRLEDVHLWMLHVKHGERVAVNCVLAAHRLLRDGKGASLADFLGLARSTGAAVLLLAEHEDALNAGRWEARFARALRYYAVAFEGADRFERHETFAGWRRRMEECGFRNAGFGEREAMQGRIITRMFALGSYSVQEQGDGEALTLRWMDQALYTLYTVSTGKTLFLRWT